MRIKHLLPIALLAALPVWGQPPADSQPAPTNVLGAQYPRVHADNRVTFQLKAPDAQKVQVSLAGRHDMTKGPDGVWSVTTPPLVPGFHYYQLIVDGVSMNDPASHAFSGTSIPLASSPPPSARFAPCWTKPASSMSTSSRPGPLTNGLRGEGISTISPLDYSDRVITGSLFS